MQKFWFLFVVIGLMGCATGYRPKGANGGYYDYPGKEENQYVVGFIGNRHTDYKKTNAYAHRHALELCKEKGLTGYIVHKDKEKVKLKKSKTEITIECK